MILRFFWWKIGHAAKISLLLFTPPNLGGDFFICFSNFDYSTFAQRRAHSRSEEHIRVAKCGSFMLIRRGGVSPPASNNLNSMLREGRPLPYNIHLPYKSQFRFAKYLFIYPSPR